MLREGEEGGGSGSQNLVLSLAMVLWATFKDTSFMCVVPTW